MSRRSDSSELGSLLAVAALAAGVERWAGGPLVQPVPRITLKAMSRIPARRPMRIGPPLACARLVNGDDLRAPAHELDLVADRLAHERGADGRCKAQESGRGIGFIFADDA